MNDRSTYPTHASLLDQVADSREEAAEVRRILGQRLTEAELDDAIASKRREDAWRASPWPYSPHNHAHRYSACKSGPCEGGAKLCPSPEACQCCERDDRIARAGAGIVLFVVAALMMAAIVATALIASGAWL